MNCSNYIIRGGDPGADRLRVLARAMMPGTLAILDRAGIGAGLSVIDLGCGSGHVAVEMAQLVGPTGRVVGLDMDERVLAHAQELAAEHGAKVEWLLGKVQDLDIQQEFDIVYARFLLSHLPDPIDAIHRMRRAVRPGGRIVVEDVDITVHTHWPPCAAFSRYIELYAAAARARGVDASIGPRLPGLFIDAELADVQLAISMPVFRTGEEKSIARLTLSNIADTLIELGLATRTEIDRLTFELAKHEADPRSIQSTAQVFQVVGRRPQDFR